VLPTPTRNPADLPHLPTPTPEQPTAPAVPANSAEAMARLHAARKPAPTPAAQTPLPTPGPGLAMLPVVVVNKVFDVVTYPLGPLGAWLRGPTGRGLLAFLGGVFLAAAGIILALDWCEWTW
jgi:hypothetical protein